MWLGERVEEWDEQLRKIRDEWDERLRKAYCEGTIEFQHYQAAKQGYLPEVVECIISLGDMEDLIATAARNWKEAYYIKLTEMEEGYEIFTDVMSEDFIRETAKDMADWEEIAVEKVIEAIPEMFKVPAWLVEVIPIEKFLETAYRDTELWGDWYWVTFTFWLPGRGLITIRNRPFIKVSMSQLAEVIDEALKHPELPIEDIIKKLDYNFEIY